MELMVLPGATRRTPPARPRRFSVGGRCAAGRCSWRRPRRQQSEKRRLDGGCEGPASMTPRASCTSSSRVIRSRRLAATVPSCGSVDGSSVAECSRCLVVRVVAVVVPGGLDVSADGGWGGDAAPCRSSCSGASTSGRGGATECDICPRAVPVATARLVAAVMSERWTPVLESTDWSSSVARCAPSTTSIWLPTGTGHGPCSD